ncbi:hypothetical protein D5085_09605 [Ectothiorhodospiraceae bacterium BW-2]|nr:hypothetical protein D5085_09605 [Ectothiorhodospiraceae bacterium BW-2]
MMNDRITFQREKSTIKRAEAYATELLQLSTAEEQHNYLNREVPLMMRSRVREIAELLQFSNAVKARLGLRQSRKGYY